ncbi:hypothetical protein FXN80_08665 [Dickeya fangzhongdai]|uniref:hypothetical protein n=1 Tax=Dickeya fangzhongdai TaxID=1778540 RepID=UPI00136DABE4|nr:hypothetical protein [Dickeya fangzhongdai]UMB78449.1 hypothetical protein FXN80_08665 [Dickeya fangzhongdai]
MGQPKHPKKKWVFTELVKDPNNIEQLISYTIYKGFKDEKAQSLRNEGKGDAEIDAELAKYHDHCLGSKKQLDVFRDKAKETLQGYVKAANSGLQARVDEALTQYESDRKKEIAALEKKVREAERSALKLLMQGADKYSKQIKKPVGVFEHITFYGLAFAKFMFSGVPKLIATAVSIGFIFAIWGFFNGDAITGLRNGLYKMVDIAVPGKKVDNTQKDVNSISPAQQDKGTNENPRKDGA